MDVNAFSTCTTTVSSVSTSPIENAAISLSTHISPPLRPRYSKFSSIIFVNNADEEIEVLGSIDLSSVAVADKKYEPILDNFKQGFRPAKADSASTIMLTDYDSDFLIYSVDAKKDELAIFSEVYYPKGWQITIDGEPAEMLRANYTLRALPIPQGKHTVEFRFDPESIKVTDRIAYGALLIMLLTAVVIFINAIKRNKTKIKKDY
jgi:uncharacterized membrane protein YfhO